MKDEEMFRDVDELTNGIYDEENEDFYPKRKTAAELELEEELKRDAAEIETRENKKTNKKDDKMEERTEAESPAQKEIKQKEAEKKEQKAEQPKGSKTPDKEQTEQQKNVDKKKTKHKTESRNNKKTPSTKPAEEDKEPKVEIIQEQGNKWVAVAAASILIVAIIVALYFVFNPGTPEVKGTESKIAAATVNGQPIYESDIDFRIQSLQGIGFQGIPRDAVLNQLVEEELIKQDAEERGIIVTQKQAEAQLEERLKQSGMTLEDFRNDVERNGYTYDQMIEFYRAQAVITKYMNETFNATEITPEEVETYYNENKDEFTIDEIITVRHILIAYENMSQNETLEKAEEVKNMLDTEDFCNLVTEYSADTATVPNCGELQYSREANIVPEFKEVTFAMDVGSIQLIKTSFGYHIVEKLDSEKDSLRPLSEVETEIRQYLQSNKEADAYQERITQLKESAIIELYKDGEQTNQNIKDSEQGADSQNTESVTEEIVEDDTKTKETLVTTQSKIKDLAECLERKGAKLYSVYWSPDTETQLEYFEEYRDLINVVECDPESAEYDVACENKEFNIYPTWEINGEEYPGVQSLRKLSEISGCEY